MQTRRGSDEGRPLPENERATITEVLGDVVLTVIFGGVGRKTGFGENRGDRDIISTGSGPSILVINFSCG